MLALFMKRLKGQVNNLKFKMMKKNRNLWNVTLSLLAAAVVLSACNAEEEPDALGIPPSDTVITALELQLSDESEMISEEIGTIAEDIYTADQLSALSQSDFRSDYLPECVEITTTITATSKEKTIDFGEGCELPNGNVLSGSIVLSYAKAMSIAQVTIGVNLQDFTFNGVAVAGGVSIVRMRSNANGNPQATADANFEATWPDGETASFSGTRTREWIEGFGSGFWGDNVFLITGNRTFVNKAGNTFTKEVLTPLRRELSCRFIVSGVLEITRIGNTASLDFGDGSCDAKGVLTKPDGTSEEVFLRRFLKN